MVSKWIHILLISTFQDQNIKKYTISCFKYAYLVCCPLERRFILGGGCFYSRGGLYVRSVCLTNLILEGALIRVERFMWTGALIQKNWYTKNRTFEYYSIIL